MRCAYFHTGTRGIKWKQGRQGKGSWIFRFFHQGSTRKYRGRENFAKGRISPLRKVAKFSPGEIFLFGGTVPSFATTAEGLCFLRIAKRLRTRLSQPFLAQMYEIWCCQSGKWCRRYWPVLLWQFVVLLQLFGRMASGALGISRLAKLSPGEIFPSPVAVPRGQGTGTSFNSSP